jgi:hypothetical protein
VDFLLDRVLTGPEMERIADMVFEYNKKQTESSPLREMEKQLKETERKIENINKAIADGAYSTSTGTMLRALENTAAQLRLSIESRKYAEGQLMDRDRILFYLTTFSRLNREDPHDRRLLIRTFLNAVYVYDDHLRILVNTSDECVQIPFEELPPESSDSFSSGLLGAIHPNFVVIEYTVPM